MLELEPEIGGTSRSSATYPWGAHYVIAPSPEKRPLTKLLEEMGVIHGGVVGELFLVRDPEERLFYRGRWYEGLYLRAGATAEDLRQLHAFEAEVGEWSRKRAFAIPVANSTSEADELWFHLAAAAVAGRLRLPRRLRLAARQHQCVGRALLLCVAR